MNLPANLNILKLLGIEDLPELQKNEISGQFQELIYDVIIDYILINLSDDDSRHFLLLMERASLEPNAPVDFAKSKIPDLEKKLAEIVNKEIIQLKRSSHE